MKTWADIAAAEGRVSLGCLIWLRDNHDLINPRLYSKIDLAAIRQDRLRKKFKAVAG